jgi:hypothetical protein
MRQFRDLRTMSDLPPEVAAAVSTLIAPAAKVATDKQLFSAQKTIAMALAEDTMAALDAIAVLVSYVAGFPMYEVDEAKEKFGEEFDISD